MGATTYRIWRLYLAGAAADFERGQNTVFQAVYVRPDGGRSGLPLTREDLCRPLTVKHAAHRPRAGRARRGDSR